MNKFITCDNNSLFCQKEADNFATRIRTDISHSATKSREV